VCVCVHVSQVFLENGPMTIMAISGTCQIASANSGANRRADAGQTIPDRASLAKMVH